MRAFFFLLFQVALCAADFDCVLIGSSPFCLFEALYQAHSGQKVLILEADAVCGGAWKTIDMCGVQQVDLGCHMIGSNARLKTFLQTYAGCSFVSSSHPSMPYTTGNFYFARGCRDLIGHLLALLEAAGVEICTNQRAGSVSINGKIATVKTANRVITTNKLVLTPMSSLVFEGAKSPQRFAATKHYHLYLLVQDTEAPQFSYKEGGVSGAKRMMNLTHFTDLLGTGRQLIIIQTHSEKGLEEPQNYIDALKKKHLLGESAYLLCSEPYVYESGKFNTCVIKEMNAQDVVEVLQTGTFASLALYIDRWETKLFPIAN